jgi:UDP-N-acetyl-D-glucosamine dehydrogenase
MRISKNPNTNEQYPIPDLLDDVAAINHFIISNKGKKVIVVQGLGFVGAVMCLVCANAINDDYAVIGIDLPDENTYWKIKTLNNGIFPLTAEDPKIEIFYRDALAKNSFYATFDTYAYSVADVIIVDINLDVQKREKQENDLGNYDVDLTGFKKAITSIGDNCKESALVLVETTVPPGTCGKVVLPILKERLKIRGLSTDGFFLGHSYERVMPGPQYIDSIQNFYRVYSGIDNRSADATESFLRTIIRTDKYPLTRLGSTNATEMAKVLENSYRAMNIAFIVEWSRFAEEANVNLYEVVNAIRMRPTHSNMMLPGVGVGGYCLTKDPLLASWARQNFFGGTSPLQQSEVSVIINDRMPEFAFNYFTAQYKQSLKLRNIVFLGVSYRGDVGDTRYTPVELLYDCFTASEATVNLHDPYVTYWEEKGLVIENDLTKVLDAHPDIVVVSTGHSLYKSSDFFEKLMQLPPLFLFDTIGIFSTNQLTELLRSHTVRVLGRGDIGH